MIIFIDASIFCALANENDVHHKNAKNIIERLIKEKQTLITSDYIFDEAINVIQRKLGKEIAISLGEHLLEGEIRIINIDQIKFTEAWKIYPRGNNFSFTDCTNIICLKELEIRDIATFDKEFKKIKGIEVIDA